MKTKQNIIFILFCFFAATTLIFGSQAENTTRRFGIFIGSNNGGKERVMLRYAISDARSMINVFSEMGGITNDDAVLLLEPTIKEINKRIDTMYEQVLLASKNNRRTEIVFYYSGHSDEDGLLLNKEKYTYRDLRDRINNIPSDMRIVILDSCASGAFTRIKGGQKTLPFLMDSSLTAEGYAFLTSSSINEVSQESDRIEASYFTHSLVTGLRGAADSVGDGRVTLNELYRFAYAETLSRTETSLHGTQHPSYDMQISGTGDVVLTDVSRTSAGIVFDEKLTGRLSIRNNQDHLIVEITKTARPMELGLEPGAYRITLQQGNDLLRTEVTLLEGKRILVAEENFAIIKTEPTRTRGEEKNFSLPKTTLYSFFFNVLYEPFTLPIVGLANLSIGNHGPIELGLANWNTENFTGLQAGLVNLTEGEFKGYQTSIVNLTGKDFCGFQSAIVNITAGNFKGFQAGNVNLASNNFEGFQAGIVNIAANDFNGFQSGLVNISGGKINGLQLGLINYADSIEKGIPIGLISVVREGGYRAVEYSFSEFHPCNVAFKIGVEKFYTSFIKPYNHNYDFSSFENKTSGGMGFGSILPIGKIFFINPEVNGLFELEKEDLASVYYTSFVPYFGVNFGIFSIAAGPSVTWVSAPECKVSNMADPLFSIYSYEINNHNKLVVGARASARVKF